MIDDRMQRKPDGAVRRELLLKLYTERTRIMLAQRIAANHSHDAVVDRMLSLGRHCDVQFEETRQSREQLTRQFLKRIMEQERDWAGEDIHPILGDLLDKIHGLTDWFAKFAELFTLSIYFECDEPRIPRESLLAWHRLCQRLDGDAMLAYMLAERGWARDIGKLSRWGLITRISDRDLDVIMRRKVSDMHLHIGGARSARLTWLALLDGELEVRNLSTYAARDRYGRDVETGGAGDALEFERSVIEAVMCALGICEPTLSRQSVNSLLPLRRFLLRPARHTVGNASADERAGLGLSRLEQRLLAERSMLAMAFQELIEIRGNGCKHNSAEASRLEHALDCYIVVKSWFLERHKQGVDTNPGLNRFRDFFLSTKIARRSDEERRTSGRVLAMRSDIPSLFAFEPGANLKRIELRLAPLPSVSDYTSFLARWAQIERRLGFKELGVDLRFAVHFKRSLGPSVPKRIRSRFEDPLRPDWFHKQGDWPEASSEPTMEASSFAFWLKSLDRDSATLHKFRNLVPANLRPLAAKIARIDLAGQERDIRADWATFNIKLLRGDQRAIEQLEDHDDRWSNDDHEFHHCWRLLKRRSLHRLSLDSLKLGLTCHAGEDFAHPIEGLFAMVTALERFDLGPGDTIGHGLAAGVDLKTYRSSNNPKVTTPRGLMFDAMIWLHNQITQYGAEHFGSSIRKLEIHLWEVAKKLYADQELPPSLFLFDKIAALRSGPVPSKIGQNVSNRFEERFLWCEYWNAETRRRRQELAPPPVILDELEPMVEWAQRRVLDLIVRQGVILEFNPSSNWRISRTKDSRPEDLGFIAIIQRMSNLVLATLGTDNPGVQDTRIENEYAIVLDGLLNKIGDRSPTSRSEALDVLERLRVVGMEYLHWPLNDFSGLADENDPTSGGYRWPGV